MKIINGLFPPTILASFYGGEAPKDIKECLYIECGTTSEGALACAGFFSPDFIDYDGAILLKSNIHIDTNNFPCLSKQFGSTKQEIEQYYNLICASDLRLKTRATSNYNEDDYEELITKLVKSLIYYWQARLKWLYPHKEFEFIVKANGLFDRKGLCFTFYEKAKTNHLVNLKSGKLNIIRGLVDPKLLVSPSDNIVKQRECIDYVRDEVTIEIALACASFFAPSFIEFNKYDNAILLEPILSEHDNSVYAIDTYYGNQKKEIEMYNNMICASDIFFENKRSEDSFREDDIFLKYLEILRHYWNQRLKVVFPERRFAFLISDKGLYEEDCLCFTFYELAD